MLVGLGTDVVEIGRMRSGADLAAPGVFLTVEEAARCANAADPAAALAAAFAAKEALFKALDLQEGYAWTDMALEFDAADRPRLQFTGPLAAHVAERRLSPRLSLSRTATTVCALVTLEAL